MTDNTKEQDWITGNRAAWREVLRMALRELRENDAPKDLELEVAKLRVQIEEIRGTLRTVCEDYGDNDWSDKLHLSDVIDKHLVDYFTSPFKSAQVLIRDGHPDLISLELANVRSPMPAYGDPPAATIQAVHGTGVEWVRVNFKMDPKVLDMRDTPSKKKKSRT